MLLDVNVARVRVLRGALLMRARVREMRTMSQDACAI